MTTPKYNVTMAIDIENYRLKIGTFHPSGQKGVKIRVNTVKTTNKYKTVNMKSLVIMRLIGIFLMLIFLQQECQNREPVKIHFRLKNINPSLIISLAITLGQSGYKLSMRDRRKR